MDQRIRNTSGKVWRGAVGQGPPLQTYRVVQLVVSSFRLDSVMPTELVFWISSWALGLTSLKIIGIFDYQFVGHPSFSCVCH